MSAQEISATVPKQYIVALAGNPNSGKTTLFNSLTGLKYKVANYPGVTVEKKQGKLELADDIQVVLMDLPGTYSLSSLSIDERIATDILLNQSPSDPAPNAVIVVIDSTNLERNLYLVTQLIDCGLPLLLALNMIDLAEKRSIVIHRELLSRALDVPVVTVAASKGRGIEELRLELEKLLRNPKTSSRQFAWLPRECPYRSSAEKIGGEIARENHFLPRRSGLFLGSGLLSESLSVADQHVTSQLHIAREALNKQGIDSHTFEATARYQWIHSVLQRAKVEHPEGSGHSRLDLITTHRVWGSCIFVLLMAFIFQSIFLWAALPMDLLSRAFEWLGQRVGALLPSGQLQSLVVDGIIAGVGSVLVFVPQIAVLFFFLGLLEDSGYLARAAFLMDKLLRKFGLQGRSFIPLLSSFACAIPGILSTRTIPSWADRMATIMVAPLMSCSARIPVYTLLIAACVPRKFIGGFLSLQGLTLCALYFLGISGACLVARTLKSTMLKGKPALFVMEMPPFRLPSLRVVLRETWDSVWAFLRNASTIILSCSIVLWFLASYPRLPDDFPGSRVQASYAGRIGTFIEPAIRPLGFNWEIGVSILSSFAAREVFVSSLATVYNLNDDGDSRSLVTVLEQKKQRGEFTLATALSLLAFYVFACQCISTLAVSRRETGSWKWTVIMFSYMTALAYCASFIVYQGGRLLFG